MHAIKERSYAGEHAGTVLYPRVTELLSLKMYVAYKIKLQKEGIYLVTIVQ